MPPPTRNFPKPPPSPPNLMWVDEKEAEAGSPFPFSTDWKSFSIHGLTDSINQCLGSPPHQIIDFWTLSTKKISHCTMPCYNWCHCQRNELQSWPLWLQNEDLACLAMLLSRLFLHLSRYIGADSWSSICYLSNLIPILIPDIEWHRRNTTDRWKMQTQEI